MHGPRSRPPWAQHAPHGPDGRPGPWDAGEWHGPPWWVPEGPPEWRTPPWARLWLPVIISGLIQVPSAVVLARITGQGTQGTALAILLALAGPLALIGARRFPGPVVAVVTLIACADLFVGDRGGPPYIALAFAIFSAVVRGARIWAWVSVGVGWIGTLVLAAVLQREDWTPFRIAGTTLGILVVFGLAEAMRSRRERLAELRRRMTERRQSAVQQERVRIARELHDVLAHSLSQINVQAGVGLHLMDRQPGKAKEALASIKDSSKSALDEVRTVLGMLRAEGMSDPPLVPEPGLDRLEELVEGSAIPATLDDRLPHAEISAPLQLALYRIVQESLTNASRHAADATRIDVVLEPDGADVVVRVTDDGRPSGVASESGGRGILGMRERAELLGGHLSAGPAVDGGFRVEARIPA